METIFAPYLWLSCVFKETLHLLEKLVEWKHFVVLVLMRIKFRYSSLAGEIS